MILLVDGVDIWDAKDTTHVSSLRQRSNMGRVVDADWAGSSEPVFAFSDGTVRVCDLNLNCLATPIVMKNVFNPQMYNSKTSLAVKYSLLLAHKVLKWDEKGHEIKDVSCDNKEKNDVVNQLKTISPNVMRRLCKLNTLQRNMAVSK